MRHDAGMNMGFEGTLYYPQGTNLHKRFVMQAGGVRTSNYTYSAFGTATWLNTTAVTGFKVFAETGTFDSMRIKVYGLL